MSALFQLVGGGLGVMPDPADNPDNHVVPHHEAGTRVSFEALNVGDQAGTASVEVTVDGAAVGDWSEAVPPRSNAVGFVSLGRLSAGQHEIVATVSPGVGDMASNSNTVDIG
ncbi:hypothetical protein [Pseudorhodoferax sp.]|uniref:hypothetical protein n=1 Tax=Pseudorhodoferax sp. TaxID=1993553 RepID=UPI002DD641AB|nr:hypothetical protein [Pseudorhodoferax sp.]